ncbi:MAG TPA: thiamine phosphate synthase [Solirubrobacteraceae bacterium]|nr:thiamine phosphate synthase [Solirubrobacteraceae bacterium]
MDPRRQRLADARLYLVCGDQPDAFLKAALRGGVDIVQLRIKDGDDASILAAGHRFKAIIERHRALFILNDRPDLVAAVDADGAHVGQDDVPVAEARRMVGSDRLLGMSTHTPEQIDAVAHAELDYIGVGPVNETPTKPGRRAVGLELVRYAAEHAAVPFFAIGGISTLNVGATRAAGGERVAVVRALTESAEPESAARELRRRLTQPHEVTVGTT